MKNGLLFLLLLFCLSVNANETPEVHASAGLFAKPVITSVDAKTTSPVTVLDDRDIVVIGKADANRPVRLFRGTTNIGQANADNAGNYLISVSSTTIVDGTYNLTVKVVNVDNSLGEASDAFVLIIDRNPSRIVTIGGASSGASIRNNKPMLKGVTLVVGKVEIFELIGAITKSLGTAKSDRSGNFVFAFETPFANGLHTLIVRNVDDQGKLGNVSSPFNITISPLLQKPTLVRINTKIVEASNTITINSLKVQVSSTTASEKFQLFINNVLAGESFSNQFIAANSLANGNYILKVRLLGLDGLTSDFSDPVNLTVSSTSAAITQVPVILSLNNKTQAPIFVNDKLKPLRLSGPAGAKVLIFCDGAAEPIGTFNAIGSYATSILVPLGSDGSTAKVVAHLVDELGNVGPPSNVFEVIREMSIPIMPVITSVDGFTVSPVRTNKSKPLIKGKAEAGSQLSILQLLGGNSASFLGFLKTDLNGNFELNPYEYANKGLVNLDGLNNIVVFSADEAGNSIETDIFVVVHDKNAADNPSAINSLKARVFTVNGSLPNENNTITANNLQIGVAAALGNRVQLFINDKLEGDQELKDSVVATFLKNNLANGKYVLTAKAIDKQGNLSPISDPITVQLISLAPAVTATPQILSYDGKTKGPIVANKAGKNLKITAPANAKLRVFYNAKKLDQVQTDVNGIFEGTFPLTGFSEGTTVKVTAFVEDDFGNFGPLSNALDLIIDNVAPAAVNIASVDNKTGTSVAIATNRPIIKGKTEVNATVAVHSNNSANLLATVKADANGDFTVNTSDYIGSFVFADGLQNVSAKATDEAGNVGVFGTVFNLTVDTKAPNAPVIVSVDAKTNTPLNLINNSPVIVGNAEVLSSITVFNGTIILGTTTANAQGIWTFTAGQLPTGSYALAAQAKDAVGNTSVRSALFVVNIQPENPVLSANNVLTPNRDGKNDFLVIKNVEFYPNNQLKIFDRSGRLIYIVDNYKNDWDGKYNGNILSEGTYYYSVELGDQQKAFKSFITIIRKSTK